MALREEDRQGTSRRRGSRAGRETAPGPTSPAATPAGRRADPGGCDPATPDRRRRRRTVTVTQANSSHLRPQRPAGLQTAASWAWRVLLVGALVSGPGLAAAVPVRGRHPGRRRHPAGRDAVPGGEAAHALGTPPRRGGRHLRARRPDPDLRRADADRHPDRLPGPGAVVQRGRRLLRVAGLAPRRSAADRRQLVPPRRVVARLQDFLASSQDTIAAWAAAIGTRVGHFLAGFAIALFALFYFLYDGRGIWTLPAAVLPRHVRDRVDQAALGGWRSLVAYVRATILVALVDAVGVLIVALILGVPLAPALAALVFIGAFIPLVGAFVSGFVAVAVALVALGWVQALIMLGRHHRGDAAGGPHPAAVPAGPGGQAASAGRAARHRCRRSSSAGIVGALLSIPILAFAKSFIQELHRRARRRGRRHARGRRPAPADASLRRPVGRASLRSRSPS